MKKKYVLIVVAVSLLTGCSSTKPITISKSEISEKDKDMICNNENYSISSIVGGGAQAITLEKDLLNKRNFQNRMESLKKIKGFSLSTFKDENGNDQIKATAQNDILFKFDSFELEDKAKIMLSELCAVIQEMPETKISIIGHTDNVGEKNYNIALSKNRALSVGNYLRENNINPDNITEDGKGFSTPVADNKSEAGRSKNRRVEILLLTPNI